MGDDDMGSLAANDEGYALESNFELQELIVPGRYAFVVAGHTLEPMVRQLNATWFINPGTAVDLTGIPTERIKRARALTSRA